MDEDQRNRVKRPLGTFCGVLAMIVFAALVTSWFVWGASGLVFYVGGLFNYSPLVFVLGLLLIPAAAIYLPMLIVRTVSRWSGLDDRKWRRRALTAIAVFVFVGPLVLACSYGGAPDDMWARGIARRVEVRADIEGIQKWLGTLGPNDLDPEGLRHKYSNAVLERSFANSEQPAAMAGLKVGATVRADDEGHLTAHLQLGGGGFMMHWGLVVGDKDMPIPPSDTSDFGEQRFPLAPGAYIWIRE